MKSQQGPFLFEIRLDVDALSSRQAYNSIYKQDNLSQIESFYLWYWKHIEPFSKGKLLDVSCGAGEMVILAAQHNLTALGIDISESAIQTANHKADQYQDNKNLRASFGVSSGESLPFPDGTFDIITNIGSLEHFLDPAQGVREMARVLHPQGRAYILVPNTFSLLTNIWEAFRHGRTSVDHQPIQRYGARADWAQLLETNGMNVLKTIRYERPWPYAFRDWGYYFKHPKDLVRLAVSPLIPLNLAYCFLFICQRSS